MRRLQRALLPQAKLGRPFLLRRVLPKQSQGEKDEQNQY
jgi:hypothetical protein